MGAADAPHKNGCASYLPWPFSANEREFAYPRITHVRGANGHVGHVPKMVTATKFGDLGHYREGEFGDGRSSKLLQGVLKVCWNSGLTARLLRAYDHCG